MEIHLYPERVLFTRDAKLYGHFLEHFHRQIYGGVFDPGSPLADEDGFRNDVIDALKKIRVPVIRWPGGCFVSDYHYTYAEGIVLRTTYHVFDLYVNRMGDRVIDMQVSGLPKMDTYDGLKGPVQVDQVDTVATVSSVTGALCISCVNKHPIEMTEISIRLNRLPESASMTTLSGDSTDDYNDICNDNVKPYDNSSMIIVRDGSVTATLPPHSVNIIVLR